MDKSNLEAKAQQVKALLDEVKKMNQGKMAANANIPMEHHESVSCCLDCACKSLQVAHDLFVHASTCCQQ